MRAFLLLFACLAHLVHARRVQKNREDQDPYHAIAAFLLANPLLSMGALRTGGPLRTRGPMMQMVPFTGGQTQGMVVGPSDPTLSRNAPTPTTGWGSKFGPIRVQGQSRKTWSYDHDVDHVQVVLTTEGRPMDADIDLWQGPDNNPVKINAYSEVGNVRPFSIVIETPRSPNTVSIRNVGPLEHPLSAHIIANDVDEPISDFGATAIIVQGTALRTFPIEPAVESVEIMLRTTDGRPLNARIEVLQAPNNNKQVIEVYTEDGIERPFFAIVETLGISSVVRLVNTGPLEFPIIASVQPRVSNKRLSDTDPVVDGPIIQ